MASVFKKTSVRIDATGKAVKQRSAVYYAKLKEGDGVVRVRSTGCRDKDSARAELNRRVREAELVRSGLLKPSEAAASKQVGRPIAEAFDAYITSLTAAGCAPRHITQVRARLDRLALECRFLRLTDLKREPLEKWLVLQMKLRMSAQTRNHYRQALVGFVNWCVEEGRLIANPFVKVPRADVGADRRHERRADDRKNERVLASNRPVMGAVR